MKVSVSSRPDPRTLFTTLTAGLAGLYFLAHLPFLAPSLEDIDSINFALGLRAFNPGLHQPHPPGYPVYIALAHLPLALLHLLWPGLPELRAETLALSIWSAIGGAVAVIGAARLFRAVATRGNGDPRVAVWATALLASAPLFWMGGLRPMSDMTGLGAVLLAQALLLEGITDRRRLVAGALLTGLAAGIRVQTLPLTLPVMAIALVEGRHQGVRWLISRPLASFGVGLLTWAVPLLVLTGGIHGYLQALGTQAGEDFAWVNMLWTNPTPRRLAFAVYDTFALPWAARPLMAAVLTAAALGALVSLWRDRRGLTVMAIAYVPYVAYHLLFQETLLVRYAMPVVPAVAWLAVTGVMALGRAALPAAVPLVAGALVVALPGGIAYAKEPHPAFRAIADAVRRAATDPPAAIYSHFELRRPLQAADTSGLRVVEPRWQHEWMGLVDYWRGGGTAPVWFLANPRRTDLELIDPRSRVDVVRYGWAAESRPELSATRPLGVDWYRLRQPEWFAGEGWSLTPETGGMTRATGSGPEHAPIQAWVRRRGGPMHAVVGVHHLGAEGAPDAEVALAIDGTVIDRWQVGVGKSSVLRFIDLPQGLPAGAGAYAVLTIESRRADAPGPSPEVAVRQFDVRPASALIAGFDDGWHEEEYASDTGLRWRWTSERSVIRVRGASGPVRVTLRGESPRKYFDRPPRVTVTSGGRIVGEFHPAADFTWSTTVPAEALTPDGALAIETDRVYLPGQVEGTADRRHLGLRLFETRVDDAQP